MVDTARTKTPWHLWVVGIVGTLWNAFGANDYYQTQAGNLEYMAGAADTMGVGAQGAMDYFQSFPAWVDAFWALGVWGALAGTILLLLRTKYAVWAFAISLLGLAGTSVYQLVSETPEWATGTMNTVITIVIWSIATFLLIYSISMRDKGVLR